MFSYYDCEADVAWFPTGQSNDVISDRVPGGLRDYDRASDTLVAIEVWDASTRLPAGILEGFDGRYWARTSGTTVVSNRRDLRLGIPRNRIEGFGGIRAAEVTYAT